MGAHPDDAELGCGGTIAKEVSFGKKVGIVDFTRGELGTRGTVESRDREAAASAAILGLSARINLNFRDGFFFNDEAHQLQLVRVIRQYQPDIVLANAIYDRHPDHGNGAALAFHACFMSGLAKVETYVKDERQLPWRPKALYHYIQSQWANPDFVVDVSGFWENKMEAIRAFKSQFYDPSSSEPETYISNPGFMKMLEARGIELGHAIGVSYGEGFTVRRTLGVNRLEDIL